MAKFVLELNDKNELYVLQECLKFFDDFGSFVLRLKDMVADDDFCEIVSCLRARSFSIEVAEELV